MPEYAAYKTPDAAYKTPGLCGPTLPRPGFDVSTPFKRCLPLYWLVQRIG